MRVIAGSSKGRVLKGAPHRLVRPTSDRIKTVLFNILGEVVVGSNFLDLCAGTGSVGIEALSRGAEKTTFVELDKRCIKVIKINLLTTKLFNQARIIVGDAHSKLKRLFAKGERFDIVFIDPPYSSDLAGQLLVWIGEHPVLLKGERLVVVQQLARKAFLCEAGSLILTKQRRVGEHVLCFYSVKNN